MNILCRLGIHHVTYEPVHRKNDWINLRRCTRCGALLDEKGRTQ